MSKQKPKDRLHALRHSAEHVLHQAMADLYPGLIRAMGPATDEGFYHDFDYDQKVSEEDFPKIEKRMRQIIDADLPITRHEISIKEARQLFKDNPYKQDWLDQIEERGEKATVYWTGQPGEKDADVDLCRGPHVDSTGQIGAFKLLSVAGAYWHGDEKNKMLTRIYGTAFPTQKELDDYLKQKEEAEKRDHRKLGEELDLFIFDKEVGQGLPLYMPKGALLRKLVMDFAFDTYLKEGYEPISTPHIASNRLWQHSGHVDFYKDGLYGEFGIEEEMYRLKPMNCPLHVAIYKARPRSYRELPLRWTEMGTVYRYEKSGVLHGMLRVRGFTQDDAHIICTPDQLHKELVRAFKLTLYILNSFGFSDFEANLSVRDPENKKKFIGSDNDWEIAEKELLNVLKEVGYEDKYITDVGGAVFYGPKIDLKLKDAIGRMWQLSTLQFDFNLPSRFNMDYVGADGQKHTPYMIHRALLGSLERFIGILIEHYAGAFPVWLSPVQVKVIPITDQQLKYAQKINHALQGDGIRVELDDRSETTSAKIRDAESQKIPYMLIVGGREEKAGSVNVRARGEKVLGEMSLDKFLDLVKKDIEKKRQV